ncbi:MFS transporter [soil metagenome]
MSSLKKFIPTLRTEISQVNFLHICNDGFQASFILLLPFIAKEFHLNLTDVGVLGTVQNAVILALALPTSYIALRLGGMKTLLMAIILYALGFIGLTFSPLFLWLIPMFILGGIGFGLFHPIAFAVIASRATKETRGRAMGNFTAVGEVGRIGISVVMTFLVVSLGWRLTSLLYGVIAGGIALLLYLFLFRKSAKSVKIETSLPNVAIGHLMRNTKFVLSLITGFLDTFASDSLFLFLPFLLLKRGIHPALLGSFTAAFFIGSFIGKSGLGRIVDTYGNTKVLIVSEILMALLILVLANTSSFSIIIIASVLLGIFTKGTVPVVQTMVTEATEHHGRFEKAFSLRSLIDSVASMIAPILLGLASDHFGIVSAFNIMAVFAALAIIPAIGFAVVKK